jgi:hypothetical protein
MVNRYELLNRITEYLANGGLFNPELMDHQEVMRLLMDVRDYLNDPTINQSVIPQNPFKWDGGCPVCGISGVNGYVCNNPKCPTKVTC